MSGTWQRFNSWSTEIPREPLDDDTREARELPKTLRPVPGNDVVQLPVFDARGGLEHRRGVASTPGLYFLGLPWQHTRGSALLGWVKDDADYIAGRIAEPPRPRPG